MARVVNYIKLRVKRGGYIERILIVANSLHAEYFVYSVDRVAIVAHKVANQIVDAGRCGGTVVVCIGRTYYALYGSVDKRSSLDGASARNSYGSAAGYRTAVCCWCGSIGGIVNCAVI